jgi:broad specificity phosphatase PhoE
MTATIRKRPARLHRAPGATQAQPLPRAGVPHASEQKWPQTLWVIRHGQSAGNVARDSAERGGLATIDIADRDVDVPLSPLGEQQADALGDWFAALPIDEQPEIILSSSYLRARQTGDRVVAALRARRGDDSDIACVRDERLREKEFGILDRLTPLGIRAKYPELAEQRLHVGKFYFRPPGGESWCDVILRLRSFLDMLTREYRSDRVLVVAHQVIVNCLRYLLERLDEAQILAIDRLSDVPNCAITSYAFDPRAGRRGKLVLQLENFVSPLREAGAPVTAEPDRPAAPKS